LADNIGNKLANSLHTHKKVKKVFSNKEQLCKGYKTSLNELDLERLLLLITYASKENGVEEIFGRTRFQKIVYIIQHKFNLDRSESGYQIHFYGPYSWSVQGSLDLLEIAGLIEENAVPTDGYIQYNYALTTLGKKVASKVFKNLSAESRNKLKKIGEEVKKLNKMSLSQVIRIAYDYARKDKRISPYYH